MRKPEDMTPKKIKLPDTGWLGDIEPAPKQVPQVDEMFTLKDIISAKAIQESIRKEKVVKTITKKTFKKVVPQPSKKKTKRR